MMETVRTEDWDDHVPTRLTASSLDLGWRHLVARSYDEPTTLAPIDVPAVPDLFIAVVRSGDREVTGRDGERPTSTARTRAGSIFIRPPGEPGQIGWTAVTPEPVEAMHLHLNWRFLNEVAEETGIGGPGAVEPVQRFAIDDPVIAHLAGAVHSELLRGGPDARMYSEMAAQFLAVHLIRFHCTRRADLPEFVARLSTKDLKRIEEHVRSDISGLLSLEALASVVHLSPYHFSRLFKAATGVSPHKYVVQERMRKARTLLEHNSRLGVLEVARAVGYSSPSQFTHQFRRAFGVTPGEFRHRRG